MMFPCSSNQAMLCPSKSTILVSFRILYLAAPFSSQITSISSSSASRAGSDSILVRSPGRYVKLRRLSTLLRVKQVEFNITKDLFLKIAGGEYDPQLCRGFRRQLIRALYAAIRVHAHSPPEKRASSDITTVTCAVRRGRSRRFKIHRTRTRSPFRRPRPGLILVSTQKY